jgi:hypothetical protein
MLSFAMAVAISASIMRAVSTLNESRLKPQYFTRKRKLPFYALLKFLLSMHKTSTQSALGNFLERKGITMSQQALSKARSKFDHTPFLKLFNGIRNAFYSSEYIDKLHKFNGKFLIAIDGSDTALPNLPSLLKKFGGTGSKASSPTARMSIAYDILNDFIMEANFSPLNVSERDHAQNHIEQVGKIIDLKDSVFIMDRGYASQELIELLSKKSLYLFRLRTKFNTEIDALPLGSHIITMYGDVKVRIVKFTLPSGEIETLLTNLFDLDESEFKDLYFRRWRIEVKYDVVKNKLEMPCFSGFSENVIMQDFWISMYLANMAAIAKNEADEKIKEQRLNKDNKYEYQANVNTLIGSMRDRLADAVFTRNPNQRQKKLERIILEIQKSVVPIRPDDGNTPRLENPRKVKYHHNKRSNL